MTPTGTTTEHSKVFVISLHRCATRSTHAFLQQLGLKAIHLPREFNGIGIEEQVRGHEHDRGVISDALSPVIEAFDAMSDVPFPALYDTLAERYPHARFIMVIRPAADWLASLRRHFAHRGELRPFPKVLYWRYFPDRPQSLGDLSDSQLLDMCARHTAEVTAYFLREGKQRLAVFDVSDPNLNEGMAAFLGFNTTSDFPHVGARKPKQAPHLRLWGTARRLIGWPTPQS